MDVGDLVKMDFEDNIGTEGGDVWGIGIIVTVEDGVSDDIEVLWPEGLYWEMSALLEVINEQA